MSVFQIFVATFLDVSTSLYFNSEQRWIKRLFTAESNCTVWVRSWLSVDGCKFFLQQASDKLDFKQRSKLQNNWPFFLMIFRNFALNTSSGKSLQRCKRWFVGLQLQISEQIWSQNTFCPFTINVLPFLLLKWYFKNNWCALVSKLCMLPFISTLYL